MSCTLLTTFFELGCDGFARRPRSTGRTGATMVRRRMAGLKENVDWTAKKTRRPACGLRCSEARENGHVVFTTHCQRDSAPRSTRSPTAHLHARLSQTLRVPPSARRGVHAVRPCRDPLTSRPSRSPADGAYSALTAAALTAAASPQPPPHRKRKNIFLTTRASTETLHLAASTGLSG